MSHSGTEIKIVILRPAEIECSSAGWSHQEASCDATNSGIAPGTQIALIMIALGMLCAGTFFWQKYYKKNDVLPSR